MSPPKKEHKVSERWLALSDDDRLAEIRAVMASDEGHSNTSAAEVLGTTPNSIAGYRHRYSIPSRYREVRAAEKKKAEQEAKQKKTVPAPKSKKPVTAAKSKQKKKPKVSAPAPKPKPKPPAPKPKPEPAPKPAPAPESALLLPPIEESVPTALHLPKNPHLRFTSNPAKQCRYVYPDSRLQCGYEVSDPEDPLCRRCARHQHT